MTSEQMFPVEMIDENAFGIWISWFDAEEVEYAQSADKFPPRIAVFRKAVRGFLEESGLGDGAQMLDFGTAVYLEIADDDGTPDVVKWARHLRAFLADGDWTTFVAVTYGGRWVPEDGANAAASTVGGVDVLLTWGPSEPFRRAMYAESRAHDDEETGEVGWGTGLFLDVDVLEAQGRKLKNEPTELWASGACFYRIGR